MAFNRKRGQSFVEFALILPILLLVLLGVVELTLFIGSYINLPVFNSAWMQRNAHLGHPIE